MSQPMVAEEPHVQDVYKCTGRQTRRFVTRAIGAGLVPFVRSSPGMGKSSIVHSIADEFGMKLLDERLSTRSPVDLAGMPGFVGAGKDRRATFTAFDNFPLEGTPLPTLADGSTANGWLLFLDEFNSASKSVQAAAYKLVLDRMVGLDKLHPQVAIVCAGNLSTDRAITNDLSTAMQSRLVHIEMILDPKEWREDVAIPQSYDYRVMAFHEFTNYDHLLDFRPDHQEKTFCCPRTWEFMHRLLTAVDDQGKRISLPIEAEDINLFAGTITAGIAADFVNYCKVFIGLPKVDDIKSSPTTAEVPTELNRQWAMVSMLMGQTDKSNFAPFTDYIERYSVDFKILFYRYVLAKDKSLVHHPAFAKKASAISRYLNDD